MNTDKINDKEVFFLILLLIPISGLGIDILVPSLPSLKNYFSTTDSLIKLNIATYLLGFCLGQILVGPVSDVIGRRSTLLVGLVVFTFSTYLSIFSPSIYCLLILRFIQGLAVTTPVVIAKAIATDKYQGQALTKVSTYLVAAWSAGPIIAPLIGGYLQEYASWKWVFLTLSGYSTLVSLLAFILLPETNTNKNDLNIKQTFQNFKIILSDREFLTNNICLSLGYSIIIAFNVLSPFLIQSEMNYSAEIFGYLSLLVGSGCFVGSIINRLLLDKCEQDVVIINTLKVALCLSMFMSFLSFLLESNIKIIITFSFLLFVCVGITYPNCSSKCLRKFPNMAGSASAIMGVITIIGTFFVSVVASYVHGKSTLPLAVTYIFLTFLIFLIFSLGNKQNGFHIKEGLNRETT